MGRTVTKKVKKTTTRPRAPDKRTYKPPERFLNSENEKIASDDSKSDSQVNGPGTRSRSRLAKEFISEQEKREERAERNRSLSSKRSSLLGAAAAIEKQQEQSDFAKKLRERVNLALQKSDSDDSFTSGQSDSDDSEAARPRMNTSGQVRIEEASHHSSLDATRPGASSPKANSLVSHAAFEELLQRTMERQTNAILDAVLWLNENQARRGTGSYIGYQQATSAHNSAIQSDAGASVVSSIANSRVSSNVISSVSQHRVRDWLTSTENITQGSLLTEANIDTLTNERVRKLAVMNSCFFGCVSIETCLQYMFY